MTTCEPKYSTPTHRWISYAEFSYWAKVADGIPQELASQNANGTVKFVNNEQSSFLSSIDTLKPWIFGALAAYVIIFISAAVAWRWPYLADVRAGRRKKADFSIYGGLLRVQPGVLPIRIVLLLLLVFAACASCFEWLFPWAATNIPALQEMSNYTAI
jgi:sortase A